MKENATFAQVKLSTITHFAQQLGQFDFKNTAGEAALRVFIVVTDNACPTHFAKTGELLASLSVRSISKASGLSRSRTDRAVDNLEAFDVLHIESTGKANRKLYAIRPANVWKSWLDLLKNGRADEATFENQNGRVDEATFDPKTAALVRPLPSNKMNDGSSYAQNDEPRFGDVRLSHGATSNGGEAPRATPAYEPGQEAIQDAKDAAVQWIASEYDLPPEHVDDLIDGFGPNACAAARDDAAAALAGALSGFPPNIAAQKIEAYSRAAVTLLRAIHGGQNLRREVYDMGRAAMNKIEQTGARYVG